MNEPLRFSGPGSHPLLYRHFQKKQCDRLFHFPFLVTLPNKKEIIWLTQILHTTFIFIIIIYYK